MSTTHTNAKSVSGTAPTGARSALPGTGMRMVNLRCLPAERGGHLVWLDCAGRTSDLRMVQALAALREHRDQPYAVGSCPAPEPDHRLPEE
ncbi:hypothetical protein [Streptomyces sp. GS7]|uniref:hypothetical protein n=1 Tax=Streptomyces sp. GS7 TaxID=2692234 RepID=UPI001315FC86|nr:hypothetical protein [Streptomyces sp. GS7]QHC22956.1 hypothetical protein GR130_17535 [Streptomyces sp. GS7]